MRDRIFKVTSLLLAFILILSAPGSALHLYAESFEEVEYGIEVPADGKDENAENTYEEVGQEEDKEKTEDERKEEKQDENNVEQDEEKKEDVNEDYKEIINDENKEEIKEEKKEQKENMNEEENEKQNQEEQNENKEKKENEQKEAQPDNLVTENHTESMIDTSGIVTYQTITVNAGYADTMIDPVQKIYPAIFNREPIFGETNDFIQVGISGFLPNDINVYASYIDLRQNLDNGTNRLHAVGGISLQFVDSNGLVYVPNDILTITIHGLPATFVYEYSEDVDREMQTGKYSGSVVVHRTSDDETQTSHNPDVWFFDEQDLILYENAISFEAMKYDFIIAQQTEVGNSDELINVPDSEITNSEVESPDSFLIESTDNFIQDVEIENQFEVEKQAEEKKNTTNELYTSIEEGDISVRFEGPESATLKTFEEEGNPQEAADALGIDEQYIESVKNVTLSIMDGDELVQPKGDVDITFKVDDHVVLPVTGNEEVVKEGDQYETTVSSMQTYAIVSILKTELSTADGTYEISTSYSGPDANLVVRELTGDEYESYVRATADTLGVSPDQIDYARAFDIKIIDLDGNEHEPNGPVTIRLKEEPDIEGEANLVHFGDETDILDVTKEQTEDGHRYEFETSSFSVFVLAYTTVYYKDCEGDTWKITVSYDKDAGIPKDAELIVNEINTDEPVIKAFDMQLVSNGEVIQPKGPVDVDIELVDVNDNMRVVSQNKDMYAYVLNGNLHYVTDHIAPIRITTIEKELVVDGVTYKVTATYDGEGADLIVTEVMENAYIADSLLRTGHDSARIARAFDVKLIQTNGEEYTGDVHIKIELEGLQECQDAEVVHYGDQVELMDSVLSGDSVEFNTNSYSVYVIIGTDGSYVPQCTYTFWTWNDALEKYTEYGFESNGTKVYHQTVTDVPIIPQLPSSGEKEFSGWFEGYVDGDTVVISDTPYDFTQPILADSAVDLYAVYKNYGYVTFHGQDNIVATKRVLIGDEVSINDVTATYVGDEPKGFYGWKYENSEEKIADDTIIVTGNLDLYPIFKEGHWLSFHTGPAHSGSNYIPPIFCFDPISELPVATRKGRTFEGWYTGTLNNDVVNYRVKFSNGTRLIADAEDDGIYVQRSLVLEADTTLYAKWSLADYKIQLWRQMGDSYEFIRSDGMKGEVGTMVSVPVRYETEVIDGFVFDHADSPKEVAEDGSTVLNVYYNIDDYEISGEPHTITFADSVEEGLTMPEPFTAVYGTELELPEVTSPRAGYAFGGWFMDADCTIPAPDVMPDRDLTLYAGWTGIKNLVEIDPNYGALYAYNDNHELIGTGSTWFNSQVDEDPIQEYTHVRRDYVKSSSGTWYYVKHDRTYYNGSGSDRKTYYTQDMTEATEDTTFEYMPGVYSYAGWYEVNADGTETPYEFGHPVDHPTSLRLHWKKAGNYYLSYDAGEGQTDQTLDGPYSDYAEVVLTRTATSENATFVGWKSKNKLYLPGDTFVIHADDAVRTGGKDIVILTAVYDTVGSATIIYDANGGTIAENANLGTCNDEALEGRIADQKAYIEGLENNVKVRLSDGTGFTRDGMEFLGWCDQPVYTGDATFFAANELCGFTGETTLYAVWGVPVHYHVNNPDIQWEAATDGVYTQTVYYGTPADEPEFHADGFLGWVEDDDFYDFSKPVTETLDLYGEWGNIRIDIHAVDPSLTLHDEWLDETRVAELTAEGIASHVRDKEVAFVAVCDEPSNITEDKAISELYYSRSDHAIRVRYTSGQDELLGDNGIYVVCFEKTDIQIEYRNVVNGTLTPSDMTEPSVYSDDLKEILGDGYLYAIGPETDLLSELTVISQNLKIRQTWKGYQYSVGDEWFDIDGITFYVLVFGNQANIVKIKEKTVGNQASFDYNCEISKITTVTTSVQKQKKVGDEWVDVDSDVSSNSNVAQGTTEEFSLNDNSRDIILEYSETASTEPGETYEENGDTFRDVTTVTNVVADQISVIQSANTAYVTTIESEAGVVEPYEWIYTTDRNDVEVTFVNTQAVMDLEVHLALIENGHVVLHDELRETDDCTFEIAMDEEFTIDSLSPDALYSNPSYAFGVIASGQNGEIEYMGITSVSYEPYEGYYALVAKNEEILGICHDVYYLYYPMPVIKYVKETSDGYQELEAITYNSEPVYMNGQQVVQNQRIEIDMDGFMISQTGNHFRMPPILDDGIYERYLAYTRIGIGDGDLIDESDSLTLELRVRNNALEYRYRDGEWLVLKNPTIYAIYTERGYDLEVDKNLIHDERTQELAGQSFTVVIRSMSINKEEYKADGAESSVIKAVKATDTEKGELSFIIRDGSRVRINGLARGTYEIEEQGSENYTVGMKTGPLNGNAEDEINGIIELNKETKVVITNTPDPVCRVGDEYFYTISNAISHINTTSVTGEGTIEMLKDYKMSDVDMAHIIHDMSVVITTNEEMDHKAVITFDHDGIIFQNDGVCEFQNIILDGGTSKGHIVSTDSLIIGTGTIVRNIHHENGNALEVKNLTVNSGTITGCSGKHVILSNGGGITLNGTARITGCVAEEGGAIYADGGSISITGTASVSGNEATNGGSIYIRNAMLTLDQSGYINGTAENGGAIYSKKGIITITDGTITGNATNGGGIYLESGTINMDGGKLNGNTAESGSAIYAKETVNMSGGEISNNRNGCAVMIDSGTATFSGGSITNNVTDGAIQVGESGALYFSGNIQVIHNGLTSEQECNVVLNKDSDTVINAVELGEEAQIGVYVTGDLNGPLFTNRGVPGAKFGSYSKADHLDVFINDRLDGLQAREESATKKIVWGKSIQIEIRQLLNFTQFPHGDIGDVKYTDANYYPGSSQIAISQLAEQMYSTYSKQLTNTAVYACAFSENATSYDDYLTDLKWDSTLNKWKGVKRNGEEVIQKIIIYYANPAYISIENNTPMALDVTDLTIDRSVINTQDVAGYGMVFAINDAIQTKLYPVSAENLHLPSGGSIRILIPGGCQKRYQFTARFDTTTGREVSFRHGSTTETLTAQQTLSPITRSEKLGNAGVTSEIIFGNDKMICKITDQGEAKPFSKISEAVEYCVTNNLTTATIEMSTDYLIPSDDVVVIPTGYDLTFKTAETEPYKYPGTRASISRDPDNKNSFITGNCSYSDFTKLTIQDLKFDGKSIRGNSDGGAVKTKNIRVDIDNCEFKNFISGNGGGIYIEFETTNTYDYQNLSNLNVTNCSFSQCSSDSTTSRQGGGAIWTNAYTFTMDGSTFTSCTAYDQGGAVFYRIDYDYLLDYRNNSNANVSNCTFTGCQARAAGGLEIDAFFTTLTDSTFTNCQATMRNGGGMNLYTQPENDNLTYTDFDSHMTVSGCTFTNCQAAKNGGGIRIMTNYTTVTNCSFSNCHATDTGGGISLTNTKGVDAAIYGCTISDCKTDSAGGGIFSKTLNLTVGSNNGTKTTIENCTSKKGGGGISHERSDNGTPTLHVEADITNCKTTTDVGGGINTFASTVEITNSSITGCNAYWNGGGIIQNRSVDATMTITGSTITGNISGNKGGGIYSKEHVALVNTTVQNNSLSVSTADYAAGIFIENNRKLILGNAGIVDNSTVSDNYTATGAKSDVRLWEGSGVNNKNSVLVRGELAGKIYVVNAKKIGSQFGTSDIAYCVGGDEDPTFLGDDGITYGIVKRTDATGKILVWAGPPICKITTEKNELLYFKSGDPAIFDRLDSRSGADGDRTSAFGFIRKPELYHADGTKYTKNVYCVQMLVTEYEAIDYISTNKQEKTIILKTASPNDEKYPLRGRGRCTISRGAAFPVKSNLITMRNNFILQDIILDGASEKGISAQVNGGLLYTKDVYNDSKMYVTIKSNAVLQNCTTSGNGGAICMDKGTLNIEGGTIKNCHAANGGGIFFQSGKTVNFKAGDILDCTTTGNGGGFNLKSGTLNMEGGTISGCSAANGGGLFVPNNTGSPFNMSGGYIIRNTATGNGGGIAIEGANSRIYFYKKPTVSGNYKGSELCNLELNQATKNVINTKNGGIFNGAYIGVYVNGEESNTNSNYFKHGLEGKPFGTYVQGDNTTTFYSFVNDRNGLKGGLISGAAARTIYWVKIFSVEVSKEVQDNQFAGNPDDVFEFLIRITGRATVTGQPNASDIEGEYGAVTFENDGSAATATVHLKAGESVTAENLSDGLTYSVTENLTEEQSEQYYQVKTSYSGLVGENNHKEGVDEKDWYISRLPFTNINPVCKITDDQGNLLYKTYGDIQIPAIYTELTDAVNALDGDLFKSATLMDKYEKTEYRIEMLVPEYILPEQVTIKEEKKVTIDTASKEGEFPFRGEETAVIKRGFDDTSMFVVNGELTLDQIVIDGDSENHAADTEGAAVYVIGKAILLEGSVIQNSYNKKSGTVYVEGQMEMSGTIAKNTTDEDGAGIYLKEGSTLKLTGSPNFGGKGINKWDDIEYKNGNIRTEEMPAKTNGAKEYTKARQDIYLTETEDAPTCIIVNGLEGESGSIWVWAVTQNHYESTKPFAVIEQAGDYSVFRNAQTDDLTLCGDTYLSGNTGENPDYVYWSGGMDVVFKKIDGFGKPQAGAVFTLYTDLACTTAYEQKGKPVTAESKTEGTDATVTFENLSSGIYYMKETGVPNGYVNAYDEDANIYVVLVGESSFSDTIVSELTEEDIQKQTGTGEDKKRYAIFLVNDEKAVKVPDIARFGVMNISKNTQETILTKTDGEEPIPDMIFDLIRYDRTVIEENCKSGKRGAFWIGSLPYGIYYLHEKNVGDQYVHLPEGDNWFELTVDENGIESKRMNKMLD